MALGTTIALIKALGNATDEQVAAAVDDWCEDNVAQETGYVLDSSLTMSNAAAPADKVGELKSDIEGIEADVLKAYPSDTVTGAIANFPDGAALPAKNITVDIAPVQSGSGDPSPNNIRPISGWTQAKVTRTGKNILKLNDGTYSVAHTTVTISNGKITVSGDSTSGGRTIHLSDVFTLPVGTYKLSPVVNSPLLLPCLNRSSDNTLLASGNNSVITVTEPIDVYFGISLDTATYSGQSISPQLECSSPATAYEPYSGNTYTITFPNEAGTVYGGTLDVTNGKLTVTDGYIASYNGETIPGEWISSMDVYAAGTTPTTGAQVVYKLATPTTYNLTPQEIQLFLGTNNVWADTGDSIVNYYADTTLYIKKLTGSTEQDMIADSAISSGKYFLVGNRLFLSTTSIAAGAKLTPGTNCTETNLAAALNAINS